MLALRRKISPNKHWDWVICELWSCELQLRVGVASCELRVASCELRVASCELRVASCELRVASCELRVASCELRVASCSCELRVASYQNQKMKISSKDNVI